MSDQNEKITVVLHVFTNLFEANVFKNNLQELGIDSFLQDENVLGFNPLGGIELKVFTEDLEKAKELLQSGKS